MINESHAYPLYFAYKNAGPTFTLLFFAIIINLISVSGVIMNLFVVFVTAMTRSLHGSANYLLALISLFEAIHQSGHLIFLAISATGINFIEFYTAVCLDLHMFFASNASLAAMTLAAFDRLFAVISPKKHKKVNKTFYLGFFTILCFLYGAYYCYYMIGYAKEHAEEPVSGYIADLLFGDPGIKFFIFSATLNGISIFCYVLVGLIIRTKSGVTKETNARLLKSLFLIISINIGGYLISLTFFEILQFLAQTFDFVLIWRIGYIPGILLNLCSACNAPVLYMTSSEYRKAISHNLHKIAQLCGMKRTAHNHSHHQQAEGDRMFNVRYTTTLEAQAAATKMASMGQSGGGARIVPNSTIQQVGGGLSTSLP